MKILVLSLSKSLKKYDKTEYLNKFDALKTDENSVDVKEIFNNSFLLKAELKKAAEKDYGLIVVSIPSDFKNNEKLFRSKFAYTIQEAERRIQKAPSAKKKGRRKKGEEIEILYYKRKITHIFPVDLGTDTAYTFNYTGTKTAVVFDNGKATLSADLPQKIIGVFTENSEAYPDGYSLKDRSVRVLTFFERHFPVKSDPSSEKIRKSVMLAAMCVFIVAAYMFVHNIYIMPMHNNAIISEIQTVFYEGQEEASGSDSNKTAEKNWTKLKKINSEIVGWIKINHTKIDYPVLWHKEDTMEDQFYLWRNYKKEYYHGGTTSIFVDWRSSKGMKSKNIILHGHHMEDGSMFSNLLKYGTYSGNLSFYKKSPVVKISTPKGGTQTYKIFSVFKSNTDVALGEYFDFYCAKFKNDSQFLNYVYNLRIRSLINCPVSVNEDDQLLTLVTCSYEFGDGSNFRTVVVARKCRKGESEDVDTGSASLNKHAVWPQCYYSRYGSYRPTVSTFRNEYKKGKLSWYDGTYTGKGSEELPTSCILPTEETTEKATKATQPKVKTYSVKIYGKNKKLIVDKKIKEGKKIKLPTIKSYKKSGYKYTLKKWKMKISGQKGVRYLKKTLKKVTIAANTKIYAVYSKAKIKTTSSKTTTKSKTTSTTSPTTPTTEAVTEASDPNENQE